ncbi:unnamed protein product [Urochloa humidicola]
MVAVSEHKQKSKLQHEDGDGERMGVADTPPAFLPPRSASFSTTAPNLEQFCSFVQYRCTAAMRTWTTASVARAASRGGPFLSLRSSDVAIAPVNTGGQ